MFSSQRLISFLGFLLTGLALLIAGCGGGEENFYREAAALHAKGDNKGAVIQLKNAIQKKPDYAEARFLLGKIYNEQGNGASAEKELRRALQLGAAKETVLPQLGQALLSQQEFKKVLEEIPASGGKPAEAAAKLAVRGNAYAALKQFDEARVAFEEARRLDPALAEADQGLAILAIMRQQPDEALRLADESIRKAPQRAASWILKADLLRAQAKDVEAAQAYQEGLKRDPNHIGAHLSLASLHMKGLRLEAAQQEIDAARKAEPSSLPVRLAQAQLDFGQKKFAQARDNLQEVLKFAPSHGPAILMMGATQLALEAYAQAETYLTSYVKADPGSAYARRLLALTFLKNKQPAKALETLKPLLAADMQDGAVLALAGDAHIQLKEYARATEYLEKATKANPQSAVLRTGLAMSRLATGDVARGTAELEVAADMEGSPLQTDMALIAAHLSKRDYDKALKVIDALEKKQPGNPLAYNLRGGAYIGKQDFANARKAFEKALSIDPAYYPAAANLAQLDLRDKNPQAARKRFDSVLAANKNSVVAMLAIATMERSAGNEKAFVEWLDKAARADAKALQPRALLVQHYISKKDAPRALSIAREAQTANPASPEALELLGVAQLAADEKDNAIATFGKLVALAPQAPAAYLRLASAQAANKSPNEARKSLNKALELKPDLLDAQIGLIGLDMQENRPNDAIKRAQQIQQQQPKSPAGYAIEADIHSKQKEFAKAAALYQKAVELDKNLVLAMKLHGSLLAAGKTGEAEAKAAQWLKEHPEDVGMRGYLAEYYMQGGQDKQAVVQYQAILQKAPDNLLVLNNLAWLLQKQQNPQALVYAERANKLKPDQPSLMDTLGWILVQQGDLKRGLPLLEQALGKQPDQPTIHYHVAVALARSGNRQRAKAELESLLSRGRAFAEEKEAKALLDQLKSGPR